jgi:hypothetical protein
MTELDVSDVKRLAREAAREQSLPLEIVGVYSAIPPSRI